MLRPVRLRNYAYAHLNVRYIDYNSMMAICDLSFVSALLTMHKRVKILDSLANVKARILQLITSILGPNKQ